MRLPRGSRRKFTSDTGVLNKRNTGQRFLTYSERCVATMFTGKVELISGPLIVTRRSHVRCPGRMLGCQELGWPFDRVVMNVYACRYYLLRRLSAWVREACRSRSGRCPLSLFTSSDANVLSREWSARQSKDRLLHARCQNTCYQRHVNSGSFASGSPMPIVQHCQRLKVGDHPVTVMPGECRDRVKPGPPWKD